MYLHGQLFDVPEDVARVEEHVLQEVEFGELDVELHHVDRAALHPRLLH